jgi:hypothetical protein
MVNAPNKNAVHRIDFAAWAAATNRYDEAVALKASVAPKTTTKDLCQLDEWWRTALPALFAAQGHLTAEQLVRAVDWKLKRGTISLPSYTRFQRAVFAVEIFSYWWMEFAPTRSPISYPSLSLF